MDQDNPKQASITGDESEQATPPDTTAPSLAGSGRGAPPEGRESHRGQTATAARELVPRKPEDLAIVTMAVSELTPYDRNPRKNDQAVHRMCDSIQEFGF